MTQTLDHVFAAIADPTRRTILAMLLEDDMAVTDVAEPFEMSLAAISKHLSVLTNAGLISQEKRGRVKWCKLEPDAMRAASIWMQGLTLMRLSGSWRKNWTRMMTLKTRPQRHRATVKKAPAPSTQHPPKPQQAASRCPVRSPR
jgi:DNA-binding transcriptional ArsR family regulator